MTGPTKVRLRVKGLALLVVVFMGGAATGAAILSTWDRAPDLPPLDAARVSVDGDPFGSLDLSQAQQRQIDTILAHLGTATDSALESSRLVLTDEANQAKVLIRGVLSPEQLVHFDSLLTELGGLRIKVSRRMVVDEDSAQ